MKFGVNIIGRITAVSVSETKGVKKKNVSSVNLVENLGIQGDAHAGKWHRQLSLLADESIDKIRHKGLAVSAGDFAENITTEGVSLWKLPIGYRFKLGREAIVEVTQIGKECHKHCAIFQQVGDCVMPREGIFTKVLKGGSIRPGDNIAAVSYHSMDTIKDYPDAPNR